MLSNKITEEMDYNIFKNYFFLFSFTMKQETIYYIYMLGKQYLFEIHDCMISPALTIRRW